ncbi:hypothetical protein [Ancylomarina longa]|uniref:DUF481 domain-containing protein n=1 Tax=Ancylomarina longa TaxID=2487017 RepID=A0A434AW58_9BACT|nr:hypothetical protein [Ancylomarina longa]RUT78739.1 hypothetical protein DLK05_06260 [Ancylomarina longa]
MLNNYKIISILVFLLFAPHFLAQAQDNQLKWGLSSQIKARVLGQSKEGEDITLNNKQAITIGAFFNYKDMEANLELMTKTVNLDLRYFVQKNVFVSFEGKWDVTDFEIDNTGKGYYNYYSGDKVNVYSYQAGLGYANTILSRLYFRGSVLAGLIHSSKESETEMLYGDYNSNLRTQKTETYQLKPSFLYGASVQLEWLPNPSKHKLRALIPFVHLGITGNHSSRVYREVSIEEWVPGNVVYNEANRPNDRLYDLFDVDFKIGLKVYLNR